MADQPVVSLEHELRLINNSYVELKIEDHDRVYTDEKKEALKEDIRFSTIQNDFNERKDALKAIKISTYKSLLELQNNNIIHEIVFDKRDITDSLDPFLNDAEQYILQFKRTLLKSRIPMQDIYESHKSTLTAFKPLIASIRGYDNITVPGKINRTLAKMEDKQLLVFGGVIAGFGVGGYLISSTNGLLVNSISGIAYGVFSSTVLLALSQNMATTEQKYVKRLDNAKRAIRDGLSFVQTEIKEAYERSPELFSQIRS